MDDATTTNNTAGIPKVRTFQGDANRAQGAPTQTTTQPSYVSSKFKEQFEEYKRKQKEEAASREKEIKEAQEKAKMQEEMARAAEAARAQEEAAARAETDKQAKQHAAEKAKQRQADDESRLREMARHAAIEERELQTKLKGLAPQRASLDQKKLQLFDQKSLIEKGLQPLVAKEEKLEEEEHKLEGELAGAATLADKQKIEKRRWEVEDARQKAEDERAKVDAQVEQLDEQIKTIDAQYQEIKNEEEKIASRLKELGVEKQADKLQEKLKNFAGRKEKLEMEWIALSDNIKAAQAQLEPVAAREGQLRVMKSQIEAEEGAAPSGEKRREAEARRRQVEEQVRRAEVERWKTEEELTALQATMKKASEEYQKVLKDEAELKVVFGQLKISP